MGSTPLNNVITVPSDNAVGDIENQHRFAEHLIGRTLHRELPSVGVSSETAAKARAVADKHGLLTGKWAAVFAGGLANVPVKAWTAEKFAELIDGLSSVVTRSAGLASRWIARRTLPRNCDAFRAPS